MIASSEIKKEKERKNKKDNLENGALVSRELQNKSHHMKLVKYIEIGR